MKEVVLFTLFFMSLSCVTAKKEVPFIPIMSARLDRCTSYCNPKYCKIKTVCRPLNRTSKYISMDIYFHRGVKFEAPVNIKVVALKKFATVYRPHMINFKTELCQELESKTHPLFFGLTKDKTFPANLFEPCPLTGHRHTQPRISNVYDYASPILRIVPTGDWRIDVVLSADINGSEVVVVSWNDYYEVKSLTAEEF